MEEEKNFQAIIDKVCEKWFLSSSLVGGIIFFFR
jgi:hypothetical protein